MNRRDLLSLVRASLAELDLAKRVAAALPARPPRGPRVRSVAIGKAAPVMTSGALARWGPAIEACLVVAPDGVAVPDDVTARAEIVRAGHPLPDARSVDAAERCLAFVKPAHEAIVLALVSGGASALVCAPSKGIDLETKRAVTEVMLRSGATVQDTNIVRKHLSRIKGGGLARAAFPNRVVTIVASDVIDGAASAVGSGPTAPDRSTVTTARKLLRQHAPAFGSYPLVATLTPTSPRARAIATPKIVASPEKLAAIVLRRLREAGVAARAIAPSQASPQSQAREYLELAKKLRPGHAIVRASEPSLVVPHGAKGRGGRSTHVAALVGRDLPRGATFLAFATDGVDGASGTGGAIVTSGFAPRDAIDRALATFDTGPLHVTSNTALPEHPTGHNLADLHVLVV